MTKRVLGISATVLAVIGIVVCLALVVGVWLGRGAVNEHIELVIDGIDSHLEKATSAVGELTATIDSARGRVQQLQARAESLAQDSALDWPAVDALATAIERQIGDDLRARREAFVALRERVEAAADSVRRAQRLLPFLRLPDVPTDLLPGLNQRMQEIEESLQDLRATLDAREGPIREVVGRLAGGLARLDERTGTLSALAGALQSRLAEARIRLRESQAAAQDWVTIAAVLLTVPLVYVALLNLSLLAHGWAWMRAPREHIQIPTLEPPIPTPIDQSTESGASLSSRPPDDTTELIEVANNGERRDPS